MSDFSIGYVEQLLSEARRSLVVGDVAGCRTIIRELGQVFATYPILGLDIDGTITEFPDIFRLLSNSWPGKVVVVSFRSDYDATFAELVGTGIRFDKLVLSPTMDKSEIIRSERISVFIDDQDECISKIDPSVMVLKVRNGGNFSNGKWLYSQYTGRSIN